MHIKDTEHPTKIKCLNISSSSRYLWCSCFPHRSDYSSHCLFFQILQTGSLHIVFEGEKTKQMEGMPIICWQTCNITSLTIQWWIFFFNPCNCFPKDRDCGQLITSNWKSLGSFEVSSVVISIINPLPHWRHRWIDFSLFSNKSRLSQCTILTYRLCPRGLIFIFLLSSLCLSFRKWAHRCWIYSVLVPPITIYKKDKVPSCSLSFSFYTFSP